MPQWIIDLEAPVDVTALLRDNEDTDTVIAQAQLATQVLQGGAVAANAGSIHVDTFTAGGARLCVDTNEKALYFGKQFIDIWNSFASSSYPLIYCMIF